MNKLLKLIIVAILTVIISCQYTIISNAADEETEATELSVITLKTSSTKLEPKDEIKVYIYYGEEETYETGIAYIEGNLEYDKNVLEAIITNGSTYNDWVADYNESDGKFALTRNDIVVDAQEVAEITFKVKENVSVKSTTIYIKNVEIANLEEDDTIESKDASLKFTISGTQSDEEDTNTNTNTNKNTNTNTNQNTNTNKNTNTNTNKNTNTSNNTNTNSNLNKNTNGTTTGGTSSNNNTSNGGTSNNGGSSSSDSTQKNGSLPYTGVVQWIVTAILVATIIGLVSYKKYQKYKNI